MPTRSRTVHPRGSARQRIVEAAHALFYRDGIRATGVDRVIAQARVTKVTFYRHFPSKNDLVHAFLEQRHAHWMHWFTEALARQRRRGRHGLDAVAPALAEWLRRADYRGCAFINAVAELATGDPVATELSRRHKRSMAGAIAALLPNPPGSRRLAAAAAQAIDGAIVQAQMQRSPTAALATLRWTLAALQQASQRGLPAARRVRAAAGRSG